MAPISQLQIRLSLVSTVSFQKIHFMEPLLREKKKVLKSLSWCIVKSGEENYIHFRESTLGFNPKFHCISALVCLLCNCRLPLFWWSSGQCLEPMYAQLLSESKHRHRLEQHGDLRRR